jgi:hypothetical protein
MTVGSGDWLGLCSASFSIIVVETVARDRLSTTTWTWLQIATELMEGTTLSAAVVALRTGQVFFAVAKRNPIELLPADRKATRLDLGFFVALPTMLYLAPRHTSPNVIDEPRRQLARLVRQHEA